MSEIQRYSYDPDWEYLIPEENGIWMLYTDHAAEVERLKAEISTLRKESILSIVNGIPLKDENGKYYPAEPILESVRAKDEEIAALTKALEDVYSCAIQNNQRLEDLNCWRGDEPTPASRALCERLFGEKK